MTALLSLCLFIRGPKLCFVPLAVSSVSPFLSQLHPRFVSIPCCIVCKAQINSIMECLRCFHSVAHGEGPSATAPLSAPHHALRRKINSNNSGDLTLQSERSALSSQQIRVFLPAHPPTPTAPQFKSLLLLSRGTWERKKKSKKKKRRKKSAAGTYTRAAMATGSKC